MNYRIKNKIGDMAFKAWKWVAPSLSERYQAFDRRLFFANEMCPDFPWKQYAGKANPYFKKWGFKVSQLDAEYYSRVSGIRADHYVTRSMAVHYIYPYLDRYDFVSAYMDKNIQKRLLGIPDGQLDVLMPEVVVSNSNGIFYDGQGRELTRAEAVRALVDYGQDTIVKPAVDSFGGHGVDKVTGGSSGDVYENLFGLYRRDFLFQKVVGQHPLMERLNPSSVNTFRIVTYRDFSGVLKVLYACLRFGGAGSVVDNVCSGGGFTGIDVATGKLLDRKQHNYFVLDSPALPESFFETAPCWEMLKGAAIALHRRLPQMGVVGWDLCLTPEEKPLLMEFNPRPGVGLQQAVGPMFSREDLDEIMRRVSKVEADYRPLGVIEFPDRPDLRTVHFKFGNGTLRNQ